MSCILRSAAAFGADGILLRTALAAEGGPWPRRRRARSTGAWGARVGSYGPALEEIARRFLADRMAGEATPTQACPRAKRVALVLARTRRACAQHPRSAMRWQNADHKR